MVAAMRRICLGAERQFEPKEDLNTAEHRLDRTDQAIALAAMLLANQLRVRAIIFVGLAASLIACSGAHGGQHGAATPSAVSASRGL